MEEFLTSVQIDKLKVLNQDPILKDALYKIFLSPIYSHGVLKKGEKHDATKNAVLTPVFNMLLSKREMWTNEQVGEWTKSFAQAVQMVEQGFGEIEKFVREPIPEKEDESKDPR